MILKKQLAPAFSCIEKLKKELQALETNEYSEETLIPLENIKAFVESYCKEHSVTKRDIAILADISPNTLSKLLKHPDTVSLSSLIALVDVIGFNIYLGVKR